MDFDAEMDGIWPRARAPAEEQVRAQPALASWFNGGPGDPTPGDFLGIMVTVQYHAASKECLCVAQILSDFLCFFF